MNISEADRQKGHEAFKRNIAITPTGGIRDPIKANSALERALDAARENAKPFWRA